MAIPEALANDHNVKPNQNETWKQAGATLRLVFIKGVRTYFC